MNLLLDLGNTRLKWARATTGQALTVDACAWDAADFDAQLAGAWGGRPKPQRVLASSVVDAEREQRLADAVRESFGAAIEWVRTPTAACGVRNAYPEPARLGVDRFLAMVAAHDTAPEPYLLIGVGTALTLDALTADGRHLGGLIAPGPRLMEQSVLGATAQVRPGEPGALVDAADNTADALHAGCWHAAAALVERFRERLGPRLGGTPVMRWSGGDAGTLAALVDAPAALVPDAVLQGLAVWARQA